MPVFLRITLSIRIPDSALHSWWSRRIATIGFMVATLQTVTVHCHLTVSFWELLPWMEMGHVFMYVIVCIIQYFTDIALPETALLNFTIFSSLLSSMKFYIDNESAKGHLWFRNRRWKTSGGLTANHRANSRPAFRE